MNFITARIANKPTDQGISGQLLYLSGTEPTGLKCVLNARGVSIYL